MTPPLLRVSGLTKSFAVAGPVGNRRLLRAVDHVGFDVAAGETFALVGESGSGKTTIGRLVLRLVEPDAGRVEFAGVDLRALDARGLRAMRRRMQIVFQDPFASLDPRETIGAAIAAPIRLHGLRRGDGVDARVRDLLGMVGLDPSFARRHPHSLSGGQRQRAVIARALAVEPELLVCDEPVAALDVSVQAQTLNLLQDLRARLGLAMIFISHDMGVVRCMADRVGILYAGRIVETGLAEDIFRHARHPYTQALLSAVPRLPPHARRERKVLEGEPPDPFSVDGGCAFAGRCPHALPACASAPPPASPAGRPGHVAHCHRLHELPVQEETWLGDAEASPAVAARLARMRARQGGHPA